MALPTEVQRAIERAHAHYPQQEQQGQGDPAPTHPTPNTAPAFGQSGEPAPTHPPQQQTPPTSHEQPRDEQGRYSQPPQQQAPQQQPQQEQTPQYDERNDATYWRARFEKLERSYSDLERYQGEQMQSLRQQAEQERNQRQQLEAQLQAMQQQGAGQQRGGDYDLSIFDAEEREAYGDDMLKTIMKATGGRRPDSMGQQQAQQGGQPYGAQSAGDNGPGFNQQQAPQDQGQQQAPRRDAQQEEAEARFYARLAQVTPNHETINHDPAFLKWLDQPDPATGMVRQEVLNYHAQHGNADKVGEMFNEFDRQANRNAPADMVQPRQRPSSAEVGGSSGSGEIWAQANIDALYRDSRKMPADEFAKWEAELFRAQREGRVQG